MLMIHGEPVQEVHGEQELVQDVHGELEPVQEVHGVQELVQEVHGVQEQEVHGEQELVQEVHGVQEQEVHGGQEVELAQEIMFGTAPETTGNLRVEQLAGMQAKVSNKVQVGVQHGKVQVAQVNNNGAGTEASRARQQLPPGELMLVAGEQQPLKPQRQHKVQLLDNHRLELVLVLLVVPVLQVPLLRLVLALVLLQTQNQHYLLTGLKTFQQKLGTKF